MCALSLLQTTLQALNGHDTIDYTYPEIVGFSPHDEPATPSAREVLRGRLQRYFSFNPIQEASALESQSAIFPKLPPPAPEGLVPIPGWRRFFFLVESTPGSMIEGSHHLEIIASVPNASTGHDNVMVLGKMSVFARARNTRCTNCQTRFRDPNFVTRGIIPVSTLAIDRLLTSGGYTSVDGPKDLAYVMSCFRVRICSSGGEVLAVPIRGASDDFAVSPVRKCTFMSAYAARSSIGDDLDGDGPVTFYGTHSCGDLVEGVSWSRLGEFSRTVSSGATELGGRRCVVM